MDVLERLVDWFLNSRIYSGEAYVAHYSGSKSGPVYPEITAYAISLSCILYRRRKDNIFLKRAEECATYLMRISQNGAVPLVTDGLHYTFDTGMFVSGMLDLYAIQGKQVYLRQAQRSLDWIYSKWDGRKFAAANKTPVEKAWFHVPSVHLAKLAIPLLKGSTFLGKQKYEEIAFELLESYMQLQLEDGAFRINEQTNAVMSHPHCYATEAFLYAYHITGRKEFFGKAKKASDWLSNTQNRDGSLHQRYQIGEKSPRHTMVTRKVKTADATAQATRIWKLLGTNRQGIEKAYNYLSREIKDNGLRLFRSESLFSRILERRVYSWPTFFLIHSLLIPYGKAEYRSELF